MYFITTLLSIVFLLHFYYTTNSWKSQLFILTKNEVRDIILYVKINHKSNQIKEETMNKKFVFAAGCIMATTTIVLSCMLKKKRRQRLSIQSTISEKDITDETLMSMAKSIEKNRIKLNGEFFAVIKAVRIINLNDDRYVEFIAINEANQSQKISLCSKDITQLNYNIICCCK